MANINEFRKTLLDKLSLSPSIVKAEGNRLYTEDGEVIRDYLAQYGVLPFGHNPDFACHAIKQHLNNKSPVFTQPVFQSATEQLAGQLIEVMGDGYKQCTFTNSGAETVEAAIKLARIKTGRKNVLSVEKSFHGKTYVALSATGSDRYSVDHLRNEEIYKRIPLNDEQSLTEALATKNYAAFIVEPILGEGGMYVADSEWLQLARKLCSSSGTLLIFDEIQTGLGRTGNVSVATELEIQPDVLLLAKSLSAGLIPTGVLLSAKKALCAEFDRKHSSTFANNGLAATASLAFLSELKKDNYAALAHVRNVSLCVDKHCEQLTQTYPGIFSSRGRGLMRALRFSDENSRNNYLVGFLLNSGGLSWILCNFLKTQHNMLTMPLMSDSRSIRFEPPLNVSSDDIDDFFVALSEICDNIKNGRYDRLMAGLIGKSLKPHSSDTQTIPVSESLPLAPHKADDAGKYKGKKFAFLMHVTSKPDLIRSMPLAVRQNYNKKELDQLAALLITVGELDFTPAVAIEFSVTSDSACADGIMIMSAISAEDMVKLPAIEKKNLINSWLDVAREEGAEVVGLGAYSSVITRGGVTITDECRDLTLTTGNSLTAMATTEVVLDLAKYNLLGSTVVIIGARGSVGKLVVSELAHWGDNLILVGRPGSENVVLKELLPILCELAISPVQNPLPGSVIDNIRQYSDQYMNKKDHHFDSPMELSNMILSEDATGQLGISSDSCYETTLGRSDYVISATSEGKSFLNTAFLKRGSIAVDTARPFDFIVQEDEPIEIIEGGLVRQPNEHMYGDCNMVGSPVGVNLACLSETAVLALSGKDGHYSIGKSIGYADAKMILEMASKHGFEPVYHTSDLLQDTPENESLSASDA